MRARRFDSRGSCRRHFGRRCRRRSRRDPDGRTARSRCRVPSPFAACHQHRARGHAGCGQLCQRRGRAVGRRQSDQPTQHHRCLAAGPVVGRRRARAGYGLLDRTAAPPGHTTFAKFTFCSGGTAANGGDFERASDPWVTFSPDGAAYQIAIAFNGLDLTNAVTVSKSTNGGATWSDPEGPDSRLGSSATRASRSTTRSRSRPTRSTRNYVYAGVGPARLAEQQVERRASRVSSTRRRSVGRSWFSRTTNGGASWETARMIADPGSHNQTIGNQIDVLPNGTLCSTCSRRSSSTKNAGGNRGVALRR